MSDSVDELRLSIRSRQRDEANRLGDLYRNLYDCQAHLVREAFYDNDQAREIEPLLSVEIFDEPWRGRFQTTGPFGLANVITLNVNGQGMDTADDLVRTLAHELGHWYVQPSKGHSREWRSAMFRRCGLVFGEMGYLEREVGLWWEIHYEMQYHVQGIDEFIRHTCEA